MRRQGVWWSAALGVLLLSAATSFAEEKEGGKPASAVALVPHNGTGFVSARIGQIWQKAEGLRKLAKDDPFMVEVLKQVDTTLGLAPEEVEQAILFFPAEKSGDPVIAVSFLKPYDKAKITARLVPNGKETKAGGKTYLADQGKQNAVYFASDRLFLASSPKELPKFLEQPAGKTGALDAAVTAVGGKHDIVIGLNIGSFLTDAPNELKPYVPFLKAHGATITVDLTDKAVTVKGRLPYESEADAKEAEKAVRDALDKLQAFLPQAITNVGQIPPTAPPGVVFSKLATFLKDAQPGLKDAKVTREGNTLHTEVTVKTKDPATGLTSVLAGFFLIVKPAQPNPPPPTVEIKPIESGR